MKLNILSDLHLSQGAPPPPDNDADVVILAGDLGRPAQAIAWAAALGKPVLFVAGNHEFYGGSLPGVAADLKRLSAVSSAGSPVRVMDKEAVVIDGVRFLGTTLWTDFLLYGEGDSRTPAAIADARRLVYDFTRIRKNETGDTLFSPEDSAALFREQSEWLLGHFAIPHAGPTVVITHHAPSERSIHPRFEGSSLNPCFVSRAEPLVAASGACLWIHGHTHDSFDYRVGETRVVCNARGYAKGGLNENPSFDPNFIVEI